MHPFIPRPENLARVHSEIDRVRPICEELKQYLAQIRESGSTKFPAACIGLVQQSIEYHETLELALSQQRFELAAWAARGLMEMHVWARYISLSDAHRDNLERNYFLDQAEILDGITAEHSDLESTEELRAEIQLLREEGRQSVTQSGTSRVRTAEMVKELGMEKVYFPANRFLSKLVHPSAFLIVSKGKGAGGIAAWLSLCAWHGIGSFREICQICPHWFREGAKTTARGASLTLPPACDQPGHP